MTKFPYHKFTANDSTLSISYQGIMLIEGNVKDAALSLAQHTFNIPIEERRIRKIYGNMIVLFHNEKYTVHMSPIVDLNEYPTWFFEFQENFNNICDKLAIFM
jgi:hypothetical protein